MLSLTTYQSGSEHRLLLGVDGAFYDLAAAMRAGGVSAAATPATGTLGVLGTGDLAALDRAARACAERVGDLAAAGLLPPFAARRGPCVPRPGKIVCVGLNYADHARETGQEVPTSPVLFAKFATSVIGPDDDVVRPAACSDLDYEAELGVVIGRRARHIDAADALTVVAGYCAANDVSARSAQIGDGQWVRGKSFDTFCPLGPMTLTTDVPDPQALRIGCRVDGETRQDSSTAQMVFGVADLVAFCSRSFTLEPGDVILTGTPPGVALGRSPSCWLEPGQECEVWIDGMSPLRNRITDEPPQGVGAGTPSAARAR